MRWLVVIAALLAAVASKTIWNARIPNIVPKAVFEHQDVNSWGDHHLVFHMSRKWYLIGSGGRAWLKGKRITAAPLQEGYPSNGVEFLAMHRAMIEYLRERFGDEPVKNDPEGRSTFSEVLDGWQTDAEVVRALLRAGKNAEKFKAGVEFMANRRNFMGEDDFANYLQTDTRRGDLPSEQMLLNNGEPAKRAFTKDRRPGAGVHNWLHGEFQEGDASPIDVGNAQLNLGNIIFWRIHGWVERKWAEWERAHRRTAGEQRLYDSMMARFRDDLRSRDRTRPIPHVPTALAQNVKPVVLSNEIDCSRITNHTLADQCPGGRTAIPTTRRVNNGTVCVTDTIKIEGAETVLAERSLLSKRSVNGIWTTTSQAALLRWLSRNQLRPARCLTESIRQLLMAEKRKTVARTTAAPRTRQPVTVQPSSIWPVEVLTAEPRLTLPREVLTAEPRPIAPPEVLIAEPRFTSPREELTTEPRFTPPRPSGAGTACQLPAENGGATGTCMDVLTESCEGGSLIRFLCPGKNNIQCCIMSA